jgi:hypothetical protein
MFFIFPSLLGGERLTPWDVQPEADMFQELMIFMKESGSTSKLERRCNRLGRRERERVCSLSFSPERVALSIRQGKNHSPHPGLFSRVVFGYTH